MRRHFNTNVIWQSTTSRNGVRAHFPRVIVLVILLICVNPFAGCLTQRKQSPGSSTYDTVGDFLRCRWPGRRGFQTVQHYSRRNVLRRDNNQPRCLGAAKVNHGCRRRDDFFQLQCE